MNHRIPFIAILLVISFATVVSQNIENNSDVEKLRIELTDSLISINGDIEKLRLKLFNDLNKLNGDFGKFKKELFDSLRTLRENVDSLKVALFNNANSLDKKEDDASNTIKYLNSLVGSFGSIFTILGVYIAIIALVLPVLVYILGIRPSQQALKELESNMDKRLDEYISDTRNKQIENALNNIRTGDTDLKNQGLTYITFTQYQGFSKDQWFQIYSIHQTSKNDQGVRSQLAFVLSTHRNDYATELFNSREIIDDPIIKQIAYIYYARTGFKDNYKGIKILFQDADDQTNDFMALATNIQQYASEKLLELINDSTIVDLLTKESLTKIKPALTEVLYASNIDKKDFEDSYLYGLIKES